MLIMLHDNRIAFSLRDRDRRDFLGKAPFILCLDGLVLRAHRKSVLIFARDAPLVGDILGGDPHVVAVERIIECTHQSVNGTSVAHARTPAHGR